MHVLKSSIYILPSLLASIPASYSAPLISINQQIPLAALSPSCPTSIPSRYESTVLGRRLLGLTPTGVLSTIFPNDTASSRSSPPASVANTPMALPEYIADCESSGDPTLIALSISMSTQNALAGSNVSLSVSWWDQYPLYTHRQPWSAANLPRISLIGYLEEIPLQTAKEQGIDACFTQVHSDSRLWLPGSSSAAHEGSWMRLKVEEVFWFGGFGDRSYIGWLDPEEWRGVKEEEWKAVRLPGEGNVGKMMTEMKNGLVKAVSWVNL